MVQLTTWNIYTPDGHYLGQYPAFAPQAALCEYMSLQGKPVTVSEVHRHKIDEDSEKLTYRTDEFIVTIGSS
jgi:hypothetical protein